MAAPRATPVPGTYRIDTGTAVLAEDDVAGGWLLTVNGAQSSHIHPDPTVVDFEYMRQMAALIETRHARSDRLRVLHLGGAACALARLLAARYPDARQVAVEIDAELARLVREWFDLPRSPLLRIRVGDAREVTSSLTEATRDVVIRDAFVGARTPRHLTSTQFTAQVHRVLVPGGMYLANCGDGRDLSVARAEVATVASAFTHVAVVADPVMLKGRRTGNVVVAGSDRPIDATPALVRTLLSDPQPAHILSGSDALRFGSRPTIHDVH